MTTCTLGVSATFNPVAVACPLICGVFPIHRHVFMPRGLGCSWSCCKATCAPANLMPTQPVHLHFSYTYPSLLRIPSAAVVKAPCFALLQVGGFFFIQRDDLKRMSKGWLKYTEDVRIDPMVCTVEVLHRISRGSTLGRPPKLGSLSRD